MVNEIVSGVVGGLIGIILGTYLTHWLNVRYTKRKVFFEKKLDYAIKTAHRLEEQAYIFVDLINKLRLIEFNKKELRKISKFSDEYKIDIKMEGHRIFFKNLQKTTNKAIEYMKMRKEFLDKLKKIDSIRTKKDFDRKLLDLDNLIENIFEKGFELEDEFKKEIIKF